MLIKQTRKPLILYLAFDAMKTKKKYFVLYLNLSKFGRQKALT